MKWVVLLFLAPLLLHAADEESTWSKPLNGVRARLFISPSQEPEFDKTYDIFLQFENVGVVGNLGTIKEKKTFQYCEMDLVLDVTDTNNQKLPRMVPGAVDEVIPSWTLCLPPGGNLSFPIGYGGAAPPRYLVSRDGPTTPVMLDGRYLMISSSLGWVIPSIGSGIYYLSGTFSTKIKDAEPRLPSGMPSTGKHSDIRLNWEGTLVLPP